MRAALLCALVVVAAALAVHADDPTIWKTSNCPATGAAAATTATGAQQSPKLLETASLFRRRLRQPGGATALNSIQQLICTDPVHGHQSRYGDDQCKPSYRETTVNPPKGLIVCYHGYSACPQQCNFFGRIAVEAGYDFFSPTHPGHGRPMKQGGCPKDDANCVEPGYDVTGVPTEAQGWTDYVDAINKAVKEHKRSEGKIRLVVGLSVGGALTMLSTLRAPGLYVGATAYSPFLGITQPQQDIQMVNCVRQAMGKEQQQAKLTQAVRKCMGDLEPKGVGKIDKFTKALFKIDDGNGWTPYNMFNYKFRLGITWASKNGKMLGDMIKMPFGWGAGCERARNADTNQGHHRAGFCGFKVAHLLATHALAGVVLDTAASAKKAVQHLRLQLVERDMVQRNGLNVLAARHMKQNGAGVCADMYRMTCYDKIFDDNSCGVPHASISYEDNVAMAGGGMYWKDKLEGDYKSWITSGGTQCFGEETFPDAPTPEDRTRLYKIDIDNLKKSDPKEYLVARIPERNMIQRAGDMASLATKVAVAFA